MITSKNLFVAAAAAFAGGLLAGTLFAPRSGKQTRDLVGRKVREQTRWMEMRVEQLEKKLEGVEQQFSTLKSEMAQRARDVAEKTVEQYVPNVSKDANEWDVQSDDVTDDLPRMPH